MKHDKKEYTKYKAIAEGNGISPMLFAVRLKRGWSMERAATENKKGSVLANEQYGEDVVKQYREQAIKKGISPTLFYNRIKGGMDIEEAAKMPRQEGEEAGKEFFLCKGDEIIEEGTVYEIAYRTGRSVSMLNNRGTKSYRESCEGTNRLVLKPKGE